MDEKPELTVDKILRGYQILEAHRRKKLRSGFIEVVWSDGHVEWVRKETCDDQARDCR